MRSARAARPSFQRPKMRALCKVLAYVDDEAEARGEPELAVLVVRQSDGLPGQGWWVGGRAEARLHRPWEGPEGGEADPQVQARAFELLGGTRGLAFAKRAAMADPRTFHRRRRRRRHPPRPLVQAALARRQLQHRVALGADRPAARRRQARRARRPGRGGPGDPRAARRGSAGAGGAAAAAARPLTDEEEQFVRDMVIYAGPRRVRAQQAAGPGDAGRHQDRRSISTACSTGSPTMRGTAQAGPPARQGHVGRAAGRAHGARRRPFRQGLFRPHGAEGLLGAGRRRPRRRRGHDRRAARQAAGHRRREDACRRGAWPAGEDPLAD